MKDDEKINVFMAQLKSEGRSSPGGNSWAEFHAFLCLYQTSRSDRPLVPLILAASGESDAAKHFRLAAQLQWVARQGRLTDAIGWLDQLARERWNTSPPETWHMSNYP